MAKFLDWDPVRGLAQYEDRTQGGNLQVHYKQDVEPVLELAKYERTHGLADKAGKKQEMYLYARIPPVIQLKLKYEMGLDIHNRNHLKRIFEVINRDYPMLKCTDKTHRLAQ
jgi:hypothetical protein